MATIHSFEDIGAWQEGRKLASEIYRITKNPPFCHDYALRDQIRRAAISISSNIAEGFERGGNKEFQQFLSFAKGSAGEVRSQLYLALDQNYISLTDFQTLADLADKIGRKTSNLASHLRSSAIRGSKFKTTTD